MLLFRVGVWFLGRYHATPLPVGLEGVGGERGRLVNLWVLSAVRKLCFQQEDKTLCVIRVQKTKQKTKTDLFCLNVTVSRDWPIEYHWRTGLAKSRIS